MADFERLTGKPCAAYIWRVAARHGTGHQIIDANNHYPEIGNRQPGFSIVKAHFVSQEIKEQGADTRIAERVVLAPLEQKVGQFDGSDNNNTAHSLGYSLVWPGYGAPHNTLDGFVASRSPLAIASIMPEAEAIDLFEGLRSSPTDARTYAQFILEKSLGLKRMGAEGESTEEFDQYFPAMQFTRQANELPTVELVSLH